ncbi:MAG: FadR family transcriptional regulator [Chloroflexi bacterium]|nr:FadR family transcriptional regulator [Chloroflexota bacterium]
MASNAAWERLRPVRASDEIVRHIRRAIFEGQLRAGDQVGSELQMAAQFGVSRNTVRDALRALEATGVVEIRNGARGGVRVAQPDPERFAAGLAVQLKLVGVEPTDVNAAQLGLEWVAAELAAANASPSDLAVLQSLIDQAEPLIENAAAFAEVSQAFHDAVARASGNWAIITSLRALEELVGESRAQHATPAVASRVLQAHREIYEAIASGDTAFAGKLMRDHVHVTRQGSRGRSPLAGTSVSSTAVGTGRSAAAAPPEAGAERSPAGAWGVPTNIPSFPAARRAQRSRSA